jgi:hypothetical protein
VKFLKDKEYETKLRSLGYAVVGNIGLAKTQRMTDFFEELNEGREDVPRDTLFTCLAVKDNAYIRKMHEELKKELDIELNKYFINFNRAVYTFQIKGIGPNTALRPHLDWSFTNENKKSSTYTLWIPLVSSKIENGTVCVMPGSHRYLRGYRGSEIPQRIDNLFDEIPKYLKPLDVEAGDILIFNSCLLHYSPDNFSNSIRVSIMVNLVDMNSSFHLYYQNKDKKIDEYLVPNEFFLNYTDLKEERKTPPLFGTKVNTYEFYSEPLTRFDLKILSLKCAFRSFFFKLFN